MKSHMITGAGGARLHLVETGNPKGPAVVFIHGFSGCWLTWTRQLESELADQFRLIAMDMRGHGDSDKPLEGYADSRLWADDVKAVIEELHLDRPVLCGWSYGPLVILDYVRHHGEDGIGGVNFIGGVTRLGSDEALSVLTAEFLNLVPGFFSDDALESVRALESLRDMCFLSKLTLQEGLLMLGCMVRVPPYVRRALFSRSFDNDDLLPELVKPVLISHGADDAVVKPAVIDAQMASIRDAQIEIMPHAGHACFWDDAATYNRRLRGFVQDL